MNVPQQCIDAQCPMVERAKGFALNSGVLPPKSGIAVILESPGQDEVVFLVKDLVDGAAEMERRRAEYPGLDERWIRMGAGVVGRAGSILWNWILAPQGLQRSDVYVANTLHCYGGKDDAGGFFYPKGPARKRAEATCADLWLKQLVDWNPTVVVEAMHPSAISRDVTPLPVCLRAVEKAKVFAARGERVLLLMGGKAAKSWMNYGENSTRWCGHWQRETDWTRARRTERWTENRGLTVTKTVKVRKLTAKSALAILLTRFSPDPFDLEYACNSGAPLALSAYDEMLALTQTKKKSKEVACAESL